MNVVSLTRGSARFEVTWHGSEVELWLSTPGGCCSALHSLGDPSRAERFAEEELEDWRMDGFVDAAPSPNDPTPADPLEALPKEIVGVLWSGGAVRALHVSLREHTDAAILPQILSDQALSRLGSLAIDTSGGDLPLQPLLDALPPLPLTSLALRAGPGPIHLATIASKIPSLRILKIESPTPVDQILSEALPLRDHLEILHLHGTPCREERLVEALSAFPALRGATITPCGPAVGELLRSRGVPNVGWWTPAPPPGQVVSERGVEENLVHKPIEGLLFSSGGPPSGYEPSGSEDDGWEDLQEEQIPKPWQLDARRMRSPDDCFGWVRPREVFSLEEEEESEAIALLGCCGRSLCVE